MVSFIGCVSLFLAVSAFSQDNSDLKKETYFHNIYKNFNESPTPESNWQNALKTNQNQTYLIQKGDTLWDVSNTFFADPQFWPKIWSLNSSDIFNPHEISPENEIVFIPGNIGEPPQVSVQAKTDSNEAPVDEAQPKAQKSNFLMNCRHRSQLRELQIYQKVYHLGLLLGIRPQNQRLKPSFRNDFSKHPLLRLTII